MSRRTPRAAGTSLHRALEATRWDTRLARSLTREITACLDLTAGLRDVLTQAQTDALVQDIATGLDLDAGLHAIIPNAPPQPAGDIPSEHAEDDPSGSEPDLRRVITHLSSLTPGQRILLRQDGDGASLAADLRHAATLIDHVIEQRRDLLALQERPGLDTTEIASNLTAIQAEIRSFGDRFATHAATPPTFITDHTFVAGDPNHDQSPDTPPADFPLALVRCLTTVLDLALDLYGARDIDPDLALALNRVRILDRERALARARARASDLDIALALDDLDGTFSLVKEVVRNLTRDRDHTVASDRDHTLASTLNRVLDLARTLADALVRALDLALDDPDLDIALALALDRARARARALDRTFDTDLARDRDLALALARDLARDLALNPRPATGAAVQDLGRRVAEARQTLTSTLDRAPSDREIASYLKIDVDLVGEADRNLGEPYMAALLHVGELMSTVGRHLSATQVSLPAVATGPLSVAGALRELTATVTHGQAVQELAAAMNDYLDADLGEVDFTKIASLDGIRWSETGTRWPPHLLPEIKRSSSWLIDDVYEIHEGADLALR